MMQTPRDEGSINVRNILQTHSSYAIQSQTETKEAKDQSTEPDHNAHHTPDYGHASSDRGFGEPGFSTASSNADCEAGGQSDIARSKAARSTIEQEPSVSVKSTDRSSQSEDYSIASSHGSSRPDRQPTRTSCRDRCTGCLEKLTQNPYRFTKVCCTDWMKHWWWVALIVVIVVVGLIVGTIIFLLPAKYTL